MKKLVTTFTLILLSTTLIIITHATHKTNSTNTTKNMFTIKKYVSKLPTQATYIIGADIGGTNSDFGIFSLSEKTPLLVLSLHAKSADINNFTETVHGVLQHLQDNYEISVQGCCFAAAGVVSDARDFCKITNVGFTINVKDIIQKTPLTQVIIANDFEVIGFGAEVIDKKNIIAINSGIPQKNGTRIIIGAGTGLGKCIMHYNADSKKYVAIPTEGGHADFSPQSNIEYELTEYIKKSENKSCVSWEDLLSGGGIARIYKFFAYKKTTHIKPHESHIHAKEIFETINTNTNSFETYQLFTKLYARCAKNFTLDTLAKGGVYIAGGIAAKHPDLFKQTIFMQEFTTCIKHPGLLKNIPIYVITDYNVSLYGAAQFLIQEIIT